MTHATDDLDILDNMLADNDIRAVGYEVSDDLKEITIYLYQDTAASDYEPGSTESLERQRYMSFIYDEVLWRAYMYNQLKSGEESVYFGDIFKWVIIN